MRAVYRIIEYTAASLLVGNILYITVGALGRYIFGKAIPNVEEVTGYVVGFITFMALALAQESKSHLLVTFLYDRLSPKHQKINWQLAKAIEILFTAILFFSSILYNSLVYAWGKVSATSFNTPQYIPIMFMTIGLGLLLVQLSLDFMGSFRRKSIQ